MMVEFVQTLEIADENGKGTGKFRRCSWSDDPQSGPVGMCAHEHATMAEADVCPDARRWPATVNDPLTVGAVKESLTTAVSQAAADVFADAERYRWLRARDLDTIHKGGVFAGMTPDNVVLNGDDLDNAIDVARLIYAAQAEREG